MMDLRTGPIFARLVSSMADAMPASFGATPTVAAENPHCGKLRLPFMKMTILSLAIVVRIRSIASAI